MSNIKTLWKLFWAPPYKNENSKIQHIKSLPHSLSSRPASLDPGPGDKRGTKGKSEGWPKKTFGRPGPRDNGEGGQSWGELKYGLTPPVLRYGMRPKCEMCVNTKLCKLLPKKHFIAFPILFSTECTEGMIKLGCEIIHKNHTEITCYPPPSYSYHRDFLWPNWRTGQHKKVIFGNIFWKFAKKMVSQKCDVYNVQNGHHFLTPFFIKKKSCQKSGRLKTLPKNSWRCVPKPISRLVARTPQFQPPTTPLPPPPRCPKDPCRWGEWCVYEKSSQWKVQAGWHSWPQKNQPESQCLVLANLGFWAPDATWCNDCVEGLRIHKQKHQVDNLKTPLQKNKKLGANKCTDVVWPKDHLMFLKNDYCEITSEWIGLWDKKTFDQAFA